MRIRHWALALFAFLGSAQAQVVAVDLNGDTKFEAYLDASHGLLWTKAKAFSSSGLTFADALAAVDALPTEGVTNWRLPSMADFLALYQTQGVTLTGSGAGYMKQAPLDLWGIAYWTTDPYVTADPRYQNNRRAFVANSLPTIQTAHYAETTRVGVWAVATVPEPSRLIQLSLGLGLLGVCRWVRGRSGAR